MVLRHLMVVLAWLWAFQTVEAQAETLLIHATHYPPFEYQDASGRSTGVDVEVAVAAFARVGIEAEVRFGPWKRVMRDVQRGTAAAALTCSETPARREFAHFSDPISQQRLVAVSKAGFAPQVLDRLQDMAAYRTLSVNGWASRERLIEQGIPHYAADNFNQVLNLLLYRDFDLLLAGWASVAHLAAQRGERDKLSFWPLSDVPYKAYFLCFSKRWPDAELLVGRFNRGLALIRADGTYQQIQLKYGL